MTGNSDSAQLRWTWQRCDGCQTMFRAGLVGRPRKYHDEACGRASRRRKAAAEAPPRETTAYGNHPYVRALDAALRDDPRTLAEISAELKAHGVTMSAATLSAHRRGHHLPRRHSDVHGVERVLKRQPGELLEKLSPRRQERLEVRPRPDGADGRDAETRRLQARISELTGTRLDRAVLTRVRDEVFTDDAGRPERIMMYNEILALEGPVSGYWLIEAADTPGTRSEVRAGKGCRLGHRIALDHDRVGFELVFDRTLDTGGSHPFEFSLIHHFTGTAAPYHRRVVLRPTMDDLQIHVHFRRRPRMVWQAEWERRESDAVRRPANMESPLLARMIRPTPKPGTYGLEWEVGR